MGEDLEEGFQGGRVTGHGWRTAVGKRVKAGRVGAGGSEGVLDATKEEKEVSSREGVGNDWLSSQGWELGLSLQTKLVQDEL